MKLLLAATAIGFLVLPASAHADRLTVRGAVDRARVAVFERAASTAATFNSVKQTGGAAVPEGALIDIYRPQCRTVTRTSAICRYRYAVVEDALSGATLYYERGRVRITRSGIAIEPTSTGAATRDGR